MSHKATTRVIVTLDASHPSVKSLGDMRSMYVISQTILKNSDGAALMRCGYAGEQDEYFVELSNDNYNYTASDELLKEEEKNAYGVICMDIVNL